MLDEIKTHSKIYDKKISHESQSDCQGLMLRLPWCGKEEVQFDSLDVPHHTPAEVFVAKM